MRATTHAFIARSASCFALAMPLAGNSVAASDDQAPIRAAILQHEQAALNAFRRLDKATYAYVRLCLPSFYEITSDGTIKALQDQPTELQDYVLGEYRMEDVVVTVVSPSVALIRT